MIFRLYNVYTDWYNSPMIKREGDAVENKERILSCALDLFYKKGYDAVGVQEIVDKAGITKPTLYHYFGSKSGLLKQLLEENFSIIEENLLQVSRYEGDLPVTLERTAMAHVQFAVNNKPFYLLLLSLFYSAKENEAYQAVEPYIKRYHRIIEDIFQNASSLLGNMHGRQAQFALGFTGILNHYIMMIYTRENEGEMLSEKRIKEIVRQFMYGIHS